MIIRTPRRRISPRTKRRYKAIKSFLAKALGTSSQRYINTNSSLEVSVSNLKSKITSIEQELNKVSKHCQDLTCLQKNIVKESEQLHKELSEVGSSRPNSKCGHQKKVETKVLYEKPGSKFRIRDDNNNTVNIKNYDSNMNPRPSQQNSQKFQRKVQKLKNNEIDKHELLRKQRRAKSKQDIFPPVHSTSSFHSLVTPKYRQYAEAGYSGYLPKQRGHEHIKIPNADCHRKKQITENDHRPNKMYGQRHVKQKRNKQECSNIDQEFIEKIINKQYRPVKMFGRRDSDFSQFSAPVCRDHEFLIREEIQEGSELCSCCFDDNRKRRHRYVRHHDLSDMRSICDTRLYSSKKHHRHTYPSRNIEDYHNSAYYDVVPVKEKSSPKSRKKFAEDNAIKYFYKEVPPSPRTRRPKLNLKAQNYTEYDDIEGSPGVSGRRHNYESESNISVQQEKLTRHQNVSVQHQANVGISGLQSPNFVDERNKTNNDTTLSTELTETNVDKTDKALGEIKDILQSFLIEIKKESTHSGKSNNTSKLDERNFNESHESDKLNSSITPNSGNNFTMPQCNMHPFVQTLPSPCCYPIIPVCPMNYLQNGYMMPNPSMTCTVCAESSKERANTEKENKVKTEKDDVNNETQELIKEIYKYVSQNSKCPKKVDNLGDNSSNNACKNRNNNMEKIIFTNRSAGGCSKASKHDANVGTPHMRCISKSCEAIGSRINSDTYYSTNASYSDTVLEKLSLHASQSSTESDVSTEVAQRKVHRNKFQKLLHSLRLFKKKKKEIVEEETESESTVVANPKQKPRPPYKQNVTNYVMHGQEYFHRPPMPDRCCPPHRERQCSYNYGCQHQPVPLSCNRCEHHVNPPYHYDQRQPNYNQIPHPQHPSYTPYQVPPQVPLCLKEVEVKSIGTQSQKKVSIFSKFAKKAEPLTRQDVPQQNSPPSIEKPSFWKTMQEKAKQQQMQQQLKQKHPDPMDFSLKTQKQLAQGDMKLRNAMLKKLFYKRNPFSPRNLIVKTLLGKDKSSFGDPPKMYRPRMFI